MKKTKNLLILLTIIFISFFCYYLSKNTNKTGDNEYCFLYLKNECLNMQSCKTDTEEQIKKLNPKIISKKEIFLTKDMFKKQHEFLFTEDIYNRFGKYIIENTTEKNVLLYFFSCKDCVKQCINVKNNIRDKYADEYNINRKNKKEDNHSLNYIHTTMNNKEVCSDVSIFLPDKFNLVKDICDK